MIKCSCPVCEGGGEKILVPGAFINHKDFMLMKNQPECLYRCISCRMVFMSDERMIQEAWEMFSSPSYAKDKKTPYNYFPFVGVVADYLGSRGGLRFLDIGCFDGKFLCALEGRYPQGEFFGYDLVRHPEFDYKFQESLSGIGRYDVISVINTMMYVDDIPGLMHSIRKLLLPGGFVFFVMPDISKSYHALLYGDQRTHYNPENTLNMWGHYGFTAEIVSCDGFPRSLVGVAIPKGCK